MGIECSLHILFLFTGTGFFPCVLRDKSQSLEFEINFIVFFAVATSLLNTLSAF